MDLNELLSYKPTNRAGEKRPLEAGERAPPPKASRFGGNDGPDGLGQRAFPSTSQASAAALDLNGISHEEKLRLLQSVDDEDEELGEVEGVFGGVVCHAES